MNTKKRKLEMRSDGISSSPIQTVLYLPQQACRPAGLRQSANR